MIEIYIIFKLYINPWLCIVQLFLMNFIFNENLKNPKDKQLGMKMFIISWKNMLEFVWIRNLCEGQVVM